MACWNEKTLTIWALLALAACGDDPVPQGDTETGSGTAAASTGGPTSTTMNASLSSTTMATTDGSDATSLDVTTDDFSGTSPTTDGSGSDSDTGSGSGSGSESSDTGETTGGQAGLCPSPEPGNPGAGGQADVLFVVDNSGSMGEEQARLAQAIGAFVERLQGEGTDVRIAVTTTDDGNPWCNGTSPEGGSFVATSCRARLSDFVFNGVPVADMTDEACLDVCAHDDLDLQPTATAENPVPAVHPWLQIGADSNLPAAIAPAEAAACMLPQGIAGCGFERPLEAMYKALLRAQMDVEDEYGFLRDTADLMVVFVTDEVDCSTKTEAATIFLPDGDKVFWSDPSAPAPTSAVCWNAGVQCSGGPGEYDDCVSALWDETGAATDEDGAVMHPVSRYVDQLADIEAGKAPGTAVRVMAITGVPEDYVDGAAIVYADSLDAAFMNNWGIGPGCTDAGGGTALPPVRLREVAEAFAEPGQVALDSVCAPTWCDLVDRIADAIVQ
jgi:hypothetical protein